MEELNTFVNGLMSLVGMDPITPVEDDEATQPNISEEAA